MDNSSDLLLFITVEGLARQSSGLIDDMISAMISGFNVKAPKKSDLVSVAKVIGEMIHGVHRTA
jgi:hypothetical protein